MSCVSKYIIRDYIIPKPTPSQDLGGFRRHGELRGSGFRVGSRGGKGGLEGNHGGFLA